AQVHPYAKIASSVLLSAYTVWKGQRERDGKISGLVAELDDLCSFFEAARPLEEIRTQKKTLQDIALQIIDCCEFISHYVRDKSFVVKAIKHIFSDVDKAIESYRMKFQEFREAFRRQGTLHTQITVMSITKQLSDLSSNITMMHIRCAKGTRFQSGKSCLPGTRTGILDDITNWAFAETNPTQNICVLFGPAGSGKSAIAHTAAKHFNNLGRLSSSYCFIRGDINTKLSLFIPTLARDIASRDCQFKEALVKVLGEDPSLHTTEDLEDQFTNFIEEPISEASLIGHMVIVIDALDECGDPNTRSKFLELLTDLELWTKLPSNYRIFVTSRPDDDIYRNFRNKPHILMMEVPEASQDIDIFVKHRLLKDTPSKQVSGIGPPECSVLATRSEGLFQWADIACRIVLGDGLGGTSPRQRYNSLLSSLQSHGSHLTGPLDAIYIASITLNLSATESKVQLTKVIGMILTLAEPVSFSTLCKFWEAAFPDDDGLELILPYMAALFSGIHGGGLICPIHTSVRDFFTDKSRSGEFFVDTNQLHYPLSLATMQVLQAELQFNICGLNTSHIPNEQIPDFEAKVEEKISFPLSYSSQFLGYHLQEVFNCCGDRERASLHVPLQTFVYRQILYWLETLSLLQRLDRAPLCLTAIKKILKEESQELIKDTLNLIRYGRYVIEQATPHLYLSAVVFLPANSKLRETIKQHQNQIARVMTGLADTWPAMEGIMFCKDIINSVAFSLDGQRVVSGSQYNTIRIWNAETGQLVSGPFEGH
ncbi:hypothetical protein M422DRAFT_79734, partial [Sphaerobolus stellatus SS14]